MAANITTDLKKRIEKKEITAKGDTKTSLEEKERKEAGEHFSLESVPTVGDGNCAFNAFALGLSEGVLADKIQCPPDFYKKVAQILLPNTPNSENFKKWLRDHTAIERQQNLQGILRKIAVECIKGGYGTLYNYHTILLDARDNPSRDDTFRYHEVIREKMEEVRAKRNKEKQAIEGTLTLFTEFPEAAGAGFDETQKVKIIKNCKERLANLDKRYDEELCTWFDTIGKKIFFDSLEQSASSALDRARWGSDVELAALARYFGINIRWSKGSVGLTKRRILGVESGLISDLSDKEKDELRNLNIGDREGEYFAIKVLHRDSLSELDSGVAETLKAYVEEQSEVVLPEVLEEKKVTEEIKEQLKRHYILKDNKILLYKHIPSEIADKKDALNKALVEFIKKERKIRSRKVPLEIAEEHQKWLRDRDIITTQGELEGSNNCPNKEAIFRKLRVIPGPLKEKVKRSFKPSSIIFEVGNSGSHWTYYRQVVQARYAAEHQLEKEAFKKLFEFIQILEQSEKDCIEIILNKMKEISVSSDDIKKLNKKIESADLDVSEKKRVLELSMSGTGVIYDRMQAKKFLSSPIAFIKEKQWEPFLERNKTNLIKVFLDKNNNLFGYFHNASIERLERFFTQFKQDKKIMPLSVDIPKVDNKWHFMAFSQFLKLQFISNKIVKKIDCRFEKITLDGLKQEFSAIKLTLLKENVGENKEKDAGVLFVRYLGNTLSIFYCGIEFFDKKEKITEKDEKKTKDNRPKKKLKRCVLKIFSSSFSEDKKSSLKGRWKNPVLKIKNKDVSERESLKILESLATADFLRGAGIDAMTRLDCYTPSKLAGEYCDTALLYKVLQHFDLAVEEVEGKENFREIHEKYKRDSIESFIKDNGVAKAQQGFCYQEHLMMLLTYLAMNDGSAKTFSLIPEAKVPEAWNDIVFEWNGELIFFQQKHRSSYSTSVTEMYSTSEILAKKGAEKDDASLLKYYKAYQELVKRIENPDDPLYRYRDKLRENKIKFIFFTNRKLPLEKVEANPGKFKLKKMKVGKKFTEIDFIELQAVAKLEIPLINLKGFPEIIDSRSVYQVTSYEAKKLASCVKEETLSKEQDSLDKFFTSFYLFAGQMGANELFLHCKKIIKPFLGGFGQAFLADTFAHYIHRAFVAENPTHAVLNRSVIKDFFDKHEYYYYNLVKYSCYNYPENQLLELLASHAKSLVELECLRKIKDSREQHLTVYCTEPSVGLAIIQSLFPAGERQVLTPFSPNLSDYTVDSRFKYIIILGEENELRSVIQKTAENPTIRIIQICAIEKSISREPTLQVKANQLDFLEKAYPSISVLGNMDICLTDLLLFSVTKLTGDLSEEDNRKYVPHTPIEEGITLPYDKLEKAIMSWINIHKDEVDLSWVTVGNFARYECRVYIDLPEILHGKSINAPSNRKFVLNTEERELYYIYKEALGGGAVKFPTSEPLSNPINFDSLSSEIEKWKQEEGSRFPAHLPKVAQCFYAKLANPYVGTLPENNKWDISDDKKFIFYYPFRKPQICRTTWSNIPLSNSTFTVIEAEAACGKTWFLRSQINQVMLRSRSQIPLFIRLKDLERVKDMERPIPEMLAYASPFSHLIRIAERNPQCFHLMLDGYDELLKEFLPRFEQFLNQLIQQGYSVTVTVRDYQLEKLQKQASHIIIQQRLSQFDDEQIKLCLRKALKGKIAVDDTALEEEIKRLHGALKGETTVSGWLGIPLHVALLSEWYLHYRNSLISSEELKPSISEIYNFILRSRIERHTMRNRSDLYKLLYKTAIMQIFSKRKEYNIFPTKAYQLKSELQFDLEKTGLLKDPFSDSPELFHRTFAEFLIAKRWCRKIIRNSAREADINFQLIQRLYQTENRLICHFFIGLYNTQDTDPDIPYELTAIQKTTFRSTWLTDINGKELVELHKPEDTKGKFVAWKKSEEVEAMEENEDKDELIELGGKSFSRCITDIKTVKEIAELEPKTFDKDKSKSYLMACFEIYQNTQNPEVLKELQKLIRIVNMKSFLRADYPKDEASLLERYQNINEFNITAVKETFNCLKKISAEYNWGNNNESHAFVCWSQGGYRDTDFAMPLLDEIGQHINIIHVFYIRLYVQYGGYSLENKGRLISTAIAHIKNLNVETENLMAVFSSVLLFLGLIEDWKSRRQQPVLPLATAEKMVRAFERLLNAPHLPKTTTLFFQVLLIDFMLFFQIRGYVTGTNATGLPSVTLISPDGFQGTLILPYNEKERAETHSAIVRKLDLQKTGIERFEQFFTVWEAVSRPEPTSPTSTATLDETAPSAAVLDGVNCPVVTELLPESVASLSSTTSRKRERSPGAQELESPLLFSAVLPGSIPGATMHPTVAEAIPSREPEPERTHKKPRSPAKR